MPPSADLVLFRDMQRARRDLDQLRSRLPSHLLPALSVLLTRG
ncbi:MAG TPA: hypothetical protein VFP59_13940 [Candidatus Angelobacter sp.]|nr:hypothetical protein [Candidatus Angelobacter sp.]